ncbi:transposase [Nostoc sp. LPT]|uniref:transposase n=1 Tax=Nostoc sp. LPT TaxID=2815387 RepID=UPI0025D12755|nr:transposase [Nostoc sp. LPT]
MSRQPRNFQPGFSYHVTTRCNNREFNLQERKCREVFLYAIKKALDKYGFKLYALCILSNHVHYLIEPVAHQDLPKIMHSVYRLHHPHVNQHGSWVISTG